MAAITIGGAAVSAVGNVVQGVGEEAALRQNAKFLDMAAGDARVRGEADASRYTQAGSRIIAEQRVAASVSGVEGKSVDDLMLDTAIMSERDAATVRYNAAREAWGYSIQAEDTRRQARGAVPRALLGAGGTILGGLASGLSMYSNSRRT